VPADRRDEEKQGLLSAVGVSSLAERVWRATLERPEASTEDLAEECGAEPGQLGSAISELVRLNLAKIDTGVAAGFAPYEPALALEMLIARGERELASQRERLHELRASISDLADGYAAARASASTRPRLEIVSNVEEARERIFLAGARTKRTHRHLMRGVRPQTILDATEVDRDSLARGVLQRTIIGATDLADPEVYCALESLNALGEEIRAMPYVPTQMMIMDDDLAVLPRGEWDSSRGVMFIRERTLVGLLIYMFDHMWVAAQPVFSAPEAPGVPAGRAARILELVAAGVKDEGIARTLGVGARTVRRDIAALRAQLGVSSRPEIVAAAVRNGWLS
jgi:DNA-binding CsgD family transcriptional regulator